MSRQPYYVASDATLPDCRQCHTARLLRTTRELLPAWCDRDVFALAFRTSARRTTAGWWEIGLRAGGAAGGSVAKEVAGFPLALAATEPPPTWATTEY